MKTTAIITGLCAFAISGFSQGRVNFQNALTSQLFFDSTALANRVTSAPLPDGGVVDVGLFWSTAVFTDSAQGTLAGVATMSATAGTFAGNGALTLPGTSAGEQIYVQVYAWDSLYANPDAALAAGALFGAWSAGPNNTVYGAVGAPELTSGLTVSPGPSIPIFGTGAGQFGRCVVLSSPEPTTLALGAAGSVALLLFRRQKRANIN